jgi:uncharacterized damage-inducible protein DinB
MTVYAHNRSEATVTAGSADGSRTFRMLEVERGRPLGEFAAWSPLRLRFRPSPGAWSVVEVLDHIVKAEAGTIADVRMGLRNPHQLGEQERPGIAALDRALRSDQRFTVPAEAGAILPDSTIALSEVAERWDRARSELKSLLDKLPADHAQSGVFRHPFAGWMTVADVLDHFSAHLYHHGFQLARLRLSSASPEAGQVVA